MARSANYSGLLVVRQEWLAFGLMRCDDYPHKEPGRSGGGLAVDSMDRWLKVNSWVLLAYLVSAQVGSLLELSPDAVSPIWPGSGVALAAVLVFGYRVVGALFVAELLHLWLQSQAGMQWPSAFLISLGVALQAAVGAALMRHLGGYPNPLASLKQVLGLLFWGGFVSTLVSASLGVWALQQFSHAPNNDQLYQWLVWWSGDAAGVFIFAPLMLAWWMSDEDAWLARRRGMLLSMLPAFLVLVLLAWVSAHWENLRLKEKFDVQAGQLYRQLDEFQQQQLVILHSLRDLFVASDSVNLDQFRAFTGPILARSAGVQALSWSPYITAEQRGRFEAQMQQRFVGFQINQRDPRGESMPAVARDDYLPVAFIEPLLLNQRALGYDLFSNPARQALVERALKARQVVSSGVLTLALPSGDEAGLLLLLPVFKQLDNEHRFEGVVSALLRLQRAIGKPGQGVLPEGMFYRVRDLSEPAKPRVLFGWGDKQAEQELALDQAPFVHRYALDFGDRRWTLEVVAGSTYLIANRHLSGWLMVLGGLLVAGLVGAFVTLMSGRDYQLRHLVKEQTRTLQRNDQRLRLTQFAADEMPVGIYLLDPEGKVVYANAEVSRELGYSPEQLLQMSVMDINPTIDALSWQKIWQRLSSEKGARFEGQHQRSDGERFDVEVIANRIDFNGRSHSLAFVQNISERKQQQARLRQLSAAIEQSPVSVIITGLDGSIEYVNPAFEQVSGYARDEVLGQNPRILKSGHTRSDEYQAMWQVLSAGGVWYGEFCNRRKDGTQYWESASITPILDEQGNPSHYLAVKEDITDSRSAREKLRQSELMLRRAQSLAHIGSWELDFRSGRLRWSDETCRIFGLAPGSALDYQGFLEFIHPDDQERLDNAWLAALDGAEYNIEASHSGSGTDKNGTAAGRV